uniref:Radical SAM domain protein n=1 Tax=uncultured bacterium W4-21b TaxID=1130993 RepID=H9BWP9_9BACT|nr:radical SAM domain protein [uncultured bacterium W4-21b]
MITLINHQGLKVSKGIQLQTPSPSIGLAYIGAYLKKHGFDYTAIDACGLAMEKIRSYEHMKDVYIQGISTKEVLERIPDETQIVGFTCLFSCCWPLVFEMAGAVRRRFPGALIVLGGEHGTALPEYSLRTNFIDVIVKGEGEETFLELVQKVEAGEDWSETQGIAYRENGRFRETSARKRVTDIDKFPLPDWDAWCLEEYIAHEQVTGVNLGRAMPILGSRGCPYACTFCSNENMWTRRYLMRDPKMLVDEMELFRDKYKVSGFTFMDLTFTVNQKKMKSFAYELTERKLGITYQLPAGTRCEAFDEELAFALAESGLKNFAFAPESGSEEILQAIRKQINIKDFLEAVRLVLKTDMVVGCYMVIGFPEDTRKTLTESLRLIRRLALMGLHDITVSQFTPYPGSDYFVALEKEGRIKVDIRSMSAIISFFSSTNESYSRVISSRELYFWMTWMYLNFYVLSFLRRPWRVLKNFFIFFTKGGIENARYMRLFADLFIRRTKWRKWNVLPEYQHTKGDPTKRDADMFDPFSLPVAEADHARETKKAAS